MTWEIRFGVGSGTMIMQNHVRSSSTSRVSGKDHGSQENAKLYVQEQITKIKKQGYVFCRDRQMKTVNWKNDTAAAAAAMNCE